MQTNSQQPELKLEPVVGSMVTVDDACRIDHSKYTLSWKPNNMARVGLRHQDTTGMVRCNRAGTCQVAEVCECGKPHLPDEHDQRTERCYDHKPYIVGGVQVWSVPMHNDKLTGQQKPEKGRT